MTAIPEALWRTAIELLARERRRVERVAYLDGYRLGEFAVATTVTVPNAVRHPRRFRVSPEAMSEAGEHLLMYRMRRLVQIHTHVDDYLDHSETDDVAAFSQREGALSIVVPHHARTRPEIAECGIHLRTAEGWSRLSPERALETVRILPTILVFQK
jgi:hypothetical protein